MSRRMLLLMVLAIALTMVFLPAGADSDSCVSNGAVTGNGQWGYNKVCSTEGHQITRTSCSEGGCSTETYCLNPLNSGFPFCG